MLNIFKKKVEQIYSVQKYNIPRLSRLFYVEKNKEAVTPLTSMESQAHYWRLLLTDGYRISFEDGKNTVVFVKGEDIIQQAVVGMPSE